jgi:hypothetical protein
VVELHCGFGILVGRFSNIVTKAVLRTRVDPNRSVGKAQEEKIMTANVVNSDEAVYGEGA